MANYSDLGSDVTVSTVTEQDVSDVEKEAEFPVFRGPWFKRSILTHLSFQSWILEKVLDQLTFLWVCLLWTFSLGF